MRKPSRKSLVARLDKTFSLAVRLRGKRLNGGRCMILNCQDRAIQCFHFITRSKHSVRWDFRNSASSCGGCNVRYEHDQSFVDDVLDQYKLEHGKDCWQTLKRDSNKTAKFSNSELIEKIKLMESDLGRPNVGLEKCDGHGLRP